MLAVKTDDGFVFKCKNLNIEHVIVLYLFSDGFLFTRDNIATGAHIENIFYYFEFGNHKLPSCAITCNCGQELFTIDNLCSMITVFKMGGMLCLTKYIYDYILDLKECLH